MEDFANCAADPSLLVWLQSACSRCAVADVETENYCQMNGGSEVFYSNERHEEDGAGKQRVNDELRKGRTRSKATSSVRLGSNERILGQRGIHQPAPRRGWGSPRLIVGGGW